MWLKYQNDCNTVVTSSASANAPVLVLAPPPSSSTCSPLSFFPAAFVRLKRLKFEAGWPEVNPPEGNQRVTARRREPITGTSPKHLVHHVLTSMWTPLWKQSFADRLEPQQHDSWNVVQNIVHSAPTVVYQNYPQEGAFVHVWSTIIWGLEVWSWVSGEFYPNQYIQDESEYTM